MKTVSTTFDADEMRLMRISEIPKQQKPWDKFGNGLVIGLCLGFIAGASLIYDSCKKHHDESHAECKALVTSTIPDPAEKAGKPGKGGPDDGPGKAPKDLR